MSDLLKKVKKGAAFGAVCGGGVGVLHASSFEAPDWIPRDALLGAAAGVAIVVADHAIHKAFKAGFHLFSDGFHKAANKLKEPHAEVDSSNKVHFSHK